VTDVPPYDEEAYGAKKVGELLMILFKISALYKSFTYLCNVTLWNDSSVYIFNIIVIVRHSIFFVVLVDSVDVCAFHLCRPTAQFNGCV